jgi:hypothetical protein
MTIEQHLAVLPTAASIVAPSKIVPTTMRGTIDAVIARHRINRDDFFGPKRSEYLVAARRDAAVRMKALGYNDYRIAREMRRDVGTIRNYYQPRGDRRAVARADGIMAKLAPDLASVVVKAAQAEEVTVEQLLVRWIADRAEGESYGLANQ